MYDLQKNQLLQNRMQTDKREQFEQEAENARLADALRDGEKPTAKRGLVRSGITLMTALVRPS